MTENHPHRLDNHTVDQLNIKTKLRLFNINGKSYCHLKLG